MKNGIEHSMIKDGLMRIIPNNLEMDSPCHFSLTEENHIKCDEAGCSICKIVNSNHLDHLLHLMKHNTKTSLSYLGAKILGLIF